jgi:hypothetical protein
MQVSYHTPVAFATNVSERETPPNLDSRITLSTSAAFINKKPLKGQSSFKAFAPGSMDFFSGLIPHILAGRAWMPAASKAQTRDCFISAQLLALDFDNNDNGDLPVSVEALKQHPLIAQYAAFVYATPSSTHTRPKSRAVFILDGTITTAEGYQAAAAALIDLTADLHPDILCKDASRLFYGSKGAEHHVNAYAVLPLAMLRAHALDMRNQDKVIAAQFKSTFDTAHKANQAYATQARHDAQRISNPHKYALTALENNSAAAAHAREGTRNRTLFVQAWKTYCVYEACGLSALDIDRAFYAAGRAAGLPDNEIRVTLASAAKYPRVVLSAMQGRAIGPDDTPPNGPGAPRRQYSAHEEYSGESRELVYYNDPHGEGVPMLAALPDAIVKHGLDIWGLPIVSELNYLYGAHSRGVLPDNPSIEEISAARLIDGIDSATPLHVYVDMVKYGILRKGKKELKDELHPNEMHTACLSNIGGILSFNSKRGRKPAAYVLPSLAELKRLMFQPMARSLMAMHPDKVISIDESVKPLVLSVLEGLLLWKRRFESFHEGLVQGFLKDDVKHRAAEVYAAIQALPITDAAMLAAMGLNADEAAAVESLASAQMDHEIAGLSALKNRLVMRLYQTHLDALDNPTTTAIAGAPLVGEAWLNAFYNARLLPHNGGYLWTHELNTTLGIDDKRSAKRAAARAGIVSEARYETRAFAVSIQADSTPTWDAVKQAAKLSAKHTDRALEGRVRQYGLIRSYDENGREIGKAEYAESDHPEGFNIGVRFSIELQLRSLITVLDAAMLADEMPESAEADAQDIETAEELGTIVPKESDTTRRRRITPARLHNRTWLLDRLLAPFCQTENGLWFNPLTGELHESAEDVLSDAIGLASKEAVS